MLCGIASPAAGRRLTVVALSGSCLVLAGCGANASSKPSRPAAERVCIGAQRAAAAILGARVRAHIAERDTAELRCDLHGRRVRVDIVSQASPRAYTEFNTITSHQEQVYGAGSVHDPRQQPQAVSVAGSSVAVWIPAQRQIVATDATPSTGGAYVTVTVAGRSLQGSRRLALARSVARATLSARPEDGP